MEAMDVTALVGDGGLLALLVWAVNRLFTKIDEINATSLKCSENHRDAIESLAKSHKEELLEVIDRLLPARQSDG